MTESARVAGDEYKTRDILLVEAVATLVAGVCGGVAQSTPYIGHPAYKAMGGRSGYTLLTGLFVGLGGMLGLVSFIVEALPEAAVTPILLFVGLEIVTQAFEACPRQHAPAVAFAFLPTLASQITIQLGGVLAEVPGGLAALSAGVQRDVHVLNWLGSGFILTAMLWGAFLAHLIDRRLARAALFVVVCGVFSLFGLIHSINPNGGVYLPWEVSNSLPLRLAIGYAVLAGFVLLLKLISTGSTTVDSITIES